MVERLERCGICRFWPRYPYAEMNDLEAGIAGGDQSECRRRAPVIAPPSSAAFPWTGVKDWCGEFQSRAPRSEGAGTPEGGK